MHYQFATVCFHQNGQKLTANTRNGQISNIIIKYSLFGSCYGTT